MEKTVLRGITWNHSRGFSPMIATSQRFSELNPDIEVVWEKRSLQKFADESLSGLTREYDLLVIDHPWAGSAASGHSLLPLDNYLGKNVLQDLEDNSVGASFKSYAYNNHQWALPIDAAAPVGSYRADLFKKENKTLPGTYDELIRLAEDGKVIVPAIPIDTLMNFYMFCVSLGEEPFLGPKEVVSERIGSRAIQLLKNLLEKVDKRCFEWNPIKVYEVLSNTDEFLYCPFAYGYSNYAREGYSSRKLYFSDVITLNDGRKLKTTLGGTGIAVSAQTQSLEAAMKYVQYITSAGCQQTLYFDAGGQPAHYAAWSDATVNLQSNNFFYNTVSTLKNAYLRPRYDGYLEFQDHAGIILQEAIIKGISEKQVLRQFNELYLKTIK